MVLAVMVWALGISVDVLVFDVLAVLRLLLYLVLFYVYVFELFVVVSVWFGVVMLFVVGCGWFTAVGLAAAAVVQHWR